MPKAKWLTTKCPNCGGHGLKASWDGCPDDCRECGGSGRLYVSSRDRVALYPGGPLRGVWPGEYARLMQGQE